jgi:hypothetical protein
MELQLFKCLGIFVKQFLPERRQGSTSCDLVLNWAVYGGALRATGDT